MKNIVRKEIEKTPKIALLTSILLLTLLISLAGAIIQHNWVLILFIVIIAILISLPRFIAKWSDISIPGRLEAYIIVFLYASLFLGELKSYYEAYWWWDVALHMSSGLAFGIIGFIILYILYKIEKIKASPKMIAMFSFAFALAVGALWEIIEFSIDYSGIFGTNMQSSLGGCSLLDTMKDLINDSIGALFSAIMGYLYFKKDSGIIVKSMVKEFKKDNPRFFKTKKRK